MELAAIAITTAIAIIGLGVLITAITGIIGAISDGFWDMAFLWGMFVMPVAIILLSVAGVGYYILATEGVEAWMS